MGMFVFRNLGNFHYVEKGGKIYQVKQLFVENKKRSLIMKKYFLLCAFLLLAGCGGQSDGTKDETFEKNQSDDNVSSVEEEKDILTIDDLIIASNMDATMETLCGALKIEYETVYFQTDDSQPSIVGICHRGEDASDESEGHIVAATPKTGGEGWNITELATYQESHPIRFVGTITDRNQQILIIEREEISARFGARDFVYIERKENSEVPEAYVVSSVHTQFGDIHIEENRVVIEDNAVKEFFTFYQGEFHHESELKPLDESADIIIYFNKNEEGKLTYSMENFSTLDVHPGDRISFRRVRPITLANFQIRTDLIRDPNGVDTFIVGENDLGKTIEVGEYPYDEMTVFTVGETPKTVVDYLQPAYVNQLKLGMMPNSKIQLTDSVGDIKSTLGEPMESINWSGAEYLQYEDFSYAIPILEEEGDQIYGILRRIPEENRVTGIELKEVWGEPTEEFLDETSHPSTYVFVYHFSPFYYVIVDLDGDSAEANVISFMLMRK